MKNPYCPFFYEKPEDKRQTMTRLADRIGVSRMTVYKWFAKGANPRLVHRQILAHHLQTIVPVIDIMLNRAHALTATGFKLPYGLIIEKNMLLDEYIEMINKNGK